MENEKRKVGDYTVLCAVNIGSREIILAENEQDSNGERFLCCYGERNDIFEKFTECAVGDDYIDAALFFAERIKQDAERFRAEVEKLDIPVTVITQADCIPDHYKNDINGKIIAINPAMNEQIYYLVDNINTAINHRKQISFRYFHYDQHRKEVPNNDGKRYRFSPYFLVWNEDHYYTVGYSEKHQKIGTFRVDRMKEVNILTADAVEKPTDFNLPEFTRQVFDMYDGSSETVTLLCKNDMMNYIVDRFGDAVETSPIDYEHFAAVAEVSVSQTFFAWVFQFNGDIQIKGPTSVVDRYKVMLVNASGK